MTSKIEKKVIALQAKMSKKFPDMDISYVYDEKGKVYALALNTETNQWIDLKKMVPMAEDKPLFDLEDQPFSLQGTGEILIDVIEKSTKKVVAIGFDAESRKFFDPQTGQEVDASNYTDGEGKEINASMFVEGEEAPAPQEHKAEEAKADSEKPAEESDQNQQQPQEQHPDMSGQGYDMMQDPNQMYDAYGQQGYVEGYDQNQMYADQNQMYEGYDQQAYGEGYDQNQMYEGYDQQGYAEGYDQNQMYVDQNQMHEGYDQQAYGEGYDQNQMYEGYDQHQQDGQYYDGNQEYYNQYDNQQQDYNQSYDYANEYDVNAQQLENGFHNAEAVQPEQPAVQEEVQEAQPAPVEEKQEAEVQPEPVQEVQEVQEPVQKPEPILEEVSKDAVANMLPPVEKHSPIVIEDHIRSANRAFSADDEELTSVYIQKKQKAPTVETVVEAASTVELEYAAQEREVKKPATVAKAPVAKPVVQKTVEQAAPTKPIEVAKPAPKVKEMCVLGSEFSTPTNFSAEQPVQKPKVEKEGAKIVEDIGSSATFRSDFNSLKSIYLVEEEPVAPASAPVQTKVRDFERVSFVTEDRAEHVEFKTKKPAPKVEVKPEPKVEVKVEIQPEPTKFEPKPEPKVEPKVEAKPEPKVETQETVNIDNKYADYDSRRYGHDRYASRRSQNGTRLIDSYERTQVRDYEEPAYEYIDDEIFIRPDVSSDNANFRNMRSLAVRSPRSAYYYDYPEAYVPRRPMMMVPAFVPGYYDQPTRRIGLSSFDRPAPLAATRLIASRNEAMRQRYSAAMARSADLQRRHQQKYGNASALREYDEVVMRQPFAIPYRNYYSSRRYSTGYPTYLSPNYDLYPVVGAGQYVPVSDRYSPYATSVYQPTVLMPYYVD